MRIPLLMTFFVFCGLVLPVVITLQPVYGQSASTSLETNYHKWGWDAYVQQNGIITVATVPKIGARTMQYDLGEHSSIFVNPDEVGKVYDLSQNNTWHNYGGYKNWPAPQDSWLKGGGGWPPSPTLDFGVYDAQVIADGPDSSSLQVTSPVETYTRWATVGLQFERTLTVYRGSSHVRVEQTMINQADKAIQWGMWGITQCITQHGSEKDWGNFWVYFPIRTDGKFGTRGFTIFSGNRGGAAAQWKANIVPGISAVQYGHQTGKIGADSPVGWVAYTDERDGYTYVKRFQIFEDETYPDQGSSVEVYTDGTLPYLEVEVLSPVVTLDPNGGHYTFVEDWYATKVNGPIVEVNGVGAVKDRLRVQSDSGNERIAFSGTYGIFYAGRVMLRYRDETGHILGTGAIHEVTPLETFALAESNHLPAGTANVDLIVTDLDGHLLGILDSLSLGFTVTAVEEEQKIGIPGQFTLSQNVPNPFNPTTTFRYILHRTGHVQFSIYNAAGQQVDRIVDTIQQTGKYIITWTGKDGYGAPLPAGVYVYELRLDNNLRRVRKMVIVKSTSPD